jgi:cysteine desulfurase
MLPYFSDVFANPSGQTSEMSWQSQSAIKKAKGQISKFIKCRANEITFTSGATESINWVFDCFMNQQKHIFISKIDHDAAFQKVSDYELRLHFKSNANGSVEMESFKKGLKELKRGSLISLIWAHNELGTVLNLKPLIDEAKKYGHFTHVDATQTLGKLDVNFSDLGLDFLSCSAHKFYGPKGIGALIVNSKTITGLKPMIAGGGQQSGMRSGTLNTPLIVGFGEAAEIAQNQLTQDQKHFTHLKEAFLNEVKDLNFTQNGDINNSLLNTINITFHDWKSMAPFHLELLPFAVSQSSACSTESNKKRILSSLNIPEAGTLRISFGRYSDIENTVALAQKIKDALSEQKTP